MYECTPETEMLASLLLDKHSQETLGIIVSDIQRNLNYDTKRLWELQEVLVPCHPHNSIDKFMIPLQCARDEIEICNINYNCTYVVLYCSKYLEEIIRFFLSVLHPVMRLKYKITSLGGLIKKLESHEFIPKTLFQASEQIYKIYSRCVDNPDIDLKPKDAVTIYLCSIIIGCRLLEYSDQNIKLAEKTRINNFYNINTRN